MSTDLKFPPLRIGILFEYGSLNGGEFSMLAVLEHISRAELEPLILCPEDGPLLQEIKRHRLRYHLLPAADVSISRDQFRRQWVNSLQLAIAQHQLHLLHANSLSMSRRLGDVVNELNCPATGHLRDIMKLSKTAMTALNRLRGVVAVSNATRDFHLQRGLDSEKSRTIYNGIDSLRFSPSEKNRFLHRELKLPEDCQLAATIGQICLRKGQNDLAAAAVQLCDRCPKLHFLLIGQRHSTKAESRDFDAAITETFSIAGMEHRLHRLKFRSDIPEILNEIDILVHPARQEPLGRVLLEAASCSVPIVATKVGGTEEILTHAETAWLVPSADPNALATGIENLLSDRDLSLRLAAAALREVTNQFSIEEASRGLLAFWRESL